MKSFDARSYSIFPPLILLSAGYIFIALYLGLVLRYEFLRSDVLGYWNDSLNWQTPFNSFHVPGYPLMIAFFRSMTFGKLPPVLLMMVINWTTFLVCVASIYKSAKIIGISERHAVIGSCLFGLWPFVGLVYTVNPLSDMPAMAFLLTGFLALLYSRKWLGAMLLGISLITHKAMWPFVIFLAFAYIYRFKPRRWKDIIAFVILFLPVFILWLAGVFYTGSPEWLFSSSANIGSDIRNTTPILEGVIGTVQQGGVKGLLKGGLIVVFFIMSVALMFLNYKFGPPYFEYGIAICAATLFLFLFLTHIEIWAAVRFSRLLALPLIWLVGYLYRDKSSIWLTRPTVGFFLLVLFSTQFLYSWYMAQVFFMK
jgi:hypothetical protein